MDPSSSSSSPHESSNVQEPHPAIAAAMNHHHHHHHHHPTTTSDGHTTQPDMQITFITIHDTTPAARITFATSSIHDILGYTPSDVIGRASFDYFHPDEIPFAEYIHQSSILLDRAAVLHYARIRSKSGGWVHCECIFNVVYDCVLACTSVYRGDGKAEKRFQDAKTARRLFTSFPRDPRYHMLEHLSAKFRTPPTTTSISTATPTTLATTLEPRVCLIINRFTVREFIMYASASITEVLGLTPEQVQNESFYDLVDEGCLEDVLTVVERAKANDSTAYVCFRYRGWRMVQREEEGMGGGGREEGSQQQEEEEAEGEAEGEVEVANWSDESEEGGVRLAEHEPPPQTSQPAQSTEFITTTGPTPAHASDPPLPPPPPPRSLRPLAPPPLLTRLSSGYESTTTTTTINTASASATDMGISSADAIFDREADFPLASGGGGGGGGDESFPTTAATTIAGSMSSRSMSFAEAGSGMGGGGGGVVEGGRGLGMFEPPEMIEAVVSCASDGLAIVLRRASKERVKQVQVQQSARGHGRTGSGRANGDNSGDNILYAAPWAMSPIHQHMHNPPPTGELSAHELHAFSATSISSPLPPNNDPSSHHHHHHTTTHQHPSASSASASTESACLTAIREMGVFAWALTGINGNLARYARGEPGGEAVPKVLPVWDPYAGAKKRRRRWGGRGGNGGGGGGREDEEDEGEEEYYRGPTNQAHDSWKRMGREAYRNRDTRWPYPYGGGRARANGNGNGNESHHHQSGSHNNGLGTANRNTTTTSNPVRVPGPAKSVSRHQYQYQQRRSGGGGGGTHRGTGGGSGGEGETERERERERETRLQKFIREHAERAGQFTTYDADVEAEEARFERVWAWKEGGGGG